MNSLFAKIVLWFVATITLTSVGLAVITAAVSSETRPRQGPFALLIGFQANEARYAYETGGPKALAAALARFHRPGRAQGVLLDASGRDLVTGEDRSDVVGEARQRPSFWLFPPRGHLLAHPTADGKYIYLLNLPDRPFFWFVNPQQFWMIGLAVLLCYLFARHLTSPLRRLQKVVECFGRGEFSVRANIARRDEFGQLARTFNEMAARIETLLAAERRLLGDISHELRSPLARLSVAVELARQSEDPEPSLNRIQKEAERLNELVGELLQVTRAEGDPSALQVDDIRLDELAEEIAADSRIEAEARGCRVEIERSVPVHVRGDEELLRRAIENILRNAIRYAPWNTAVRVCIDNLGERARISIRDHGPGVPDEALTRIFDAFYRVESDRGRSTGGAGLGLSIARRAIELHKGALQARNADPGLLVEIELPLAAVPAAVSP